MSYLQKSTNPTILISQEDKPNLNCSVPFRHVIESLPGQFPIPSPVIRFGLLTRHLEPESEEYEINTTNMNIESTSTAVVPPQTLAQIRWLLSNHSSHLTEREKNRIGKLCSASRLNRPPEMGSDDIEKIKTNSNTSINDSVFQLKKSKEYTCEYCDKSFKQKNSLRVHKSQNCDEQSSKSSSKDRPTFGKEIRKDRGSERVFGRNPYADTEKLKDTGLHQGGG